MRFISRNVRRSISSALLALLRLRLRRGRGRGSVRKQDSLLAWRAPHRYRAGDRGVAAAGGSDRPLAARTAKPAGLSTGSVVPNRVICEPPRRLQLDLTVRNYRDRDGSTRYCYLLPTALNPRRCA